MTTNRKGEWGKHQTSNDSRLHLHPHNNSQRRIHLKSCGLIVFLSISVVSLLGNNGIISYESLTRDSEQQAIEKANKTTTAYTPKSTQHLVYNFSLVIESLPEESYQYFNTTTSKNNTAISSPPNDPSKLSFLDTSSPSNEPLEGLLSSTTHTNEVSETPLVREFGRDKIDTASKDQSLKIDQSKNHAGKIRRVWTACAECQRGKPSQSFSCSDHIDRRLDFDYSNITYVQEILRIVSDEYEACSPACLPQNCNIEEIIEVDADLAAPPILYAVTPSIKTIPIEHQPPRTNMTREQMTDYVVNFTATNRYLLPTFNPSIIHAPKEIRDQLNGAAYLASFRASPQTGCVEGYQFWKYKDINFHILALLDQDLNIMAEVVLDINRHQGTSRFEDCRLFVINGTTVLSHSHFLLPIVVSVEGGGGGALVERSPGNMLEVPLAFPHLDNMPKLLVHYLSDGNIIYLDGLEGKNFHYFQDLNGAYYLEYAPSVPHRVFRLPSLRHKQTNRRFARIVHVNETTQMSNKTTYELKPSFTNPRKVRSIRWSNGRGSACCVRLERNLYQDLIDPDNKETAAAAVRNEYLLLGIQHHRTFRKNYTYSSRLYAFEPTKPFNTVAITGLFCFGFPREQTDNPFASLAAEDTWSFRKSQYTRCPAIHYVSGMTDVFNDSSKVVVGYGINDCSSRFVVIGKRDMAELLFRPFPQVS